MADQFHILNGDSLKLQFPKNIEGKIIVARECLVDGPVSGTTFDDLFSTRSKFISQSFSDFSEKEYDKKSISEFRQMQQIPENAEINLWFEDDLFCQVNLWFVLHLLNENQKKYQLALIRPNKGNEYSFGHMSNNELLEAYKNRTNISKFDFLKLATLWKLYQINSIEEMMDIAKEIKINYPFLSPAIHAHYQRIPKNNFPGKPVQTIIEIIDELKTTEFIPVFKEFCKREAIYGFGDQQVKSMLDKLKPN